MQLARDLPGRDNQVVTAWAGIIESSWLSHGVRAYAESDVVPYPHDAELPAAALFIVGDSEHWYASAAGQAAQAVWLAATDPQRETAVCLSLCGRWAPPNGIPSNLDNMDLPVAVMRGVGEVRTTTYGTHGAVTSLEVTPATRPSRPGTIWLPSWVWDPHPLTGRPVSEAAAYLTHDQLFAWPVPAPSGVGPGQRWLCPQPPGTRLWWTLMAFSITVAGHDVILTEPGGSWHKNEVTQTRATAMAATAEQWQWVAQTWPEQARALRLNHVVIAQHDPAPETEKWLSSIYPDANVTYGFG